VVEIKDGKLELLFVFESPACSGYENSENRSKVGSKSLATLLILGSRFHSLFLKPSYQGAVPKIAGSPSLVEITLRIVTTLWTVANCIFLYILLVLSDAIEKH